MVRERRIETGPWEGGRLAETRKSWRRQWPKSESFSSWRGCSRSRARRSLPWSTSALDWPSDTRVAAPRPPDSRWQGVEIMVPLEPAAASNLSAQTPTRVLVLRTGNSARSQMAEGVLKSLDPHLDVQSAGTAPAPHVNAYAMLGMQEIGIDISGERPKSVMQFVEQSFGYVITVCDDADKNCPVFSGKVGTRARIGFPDPAEAKGTDEQIMKVFREVRDDVRTKFTAYYRQEIARTTS